MRYSKIFGTGGYLPKKIVTNYDLEKKLETTHDWIVQRTGIHQRHKADETESVSMMAKEAAKQALENAGVSPSQVGLIIVATCTGETVFPSSAGYVQKTLGISECPAFDLSAACAGFIFALSFADSYIKTGQCDYALVIGSEVMSRVVNQEDRSVAVLFGDGAGAVLLGPSAQPGIIASKLHTNANYGHMLYLDQFYPGDRNCEDISKYYVHMDGREVFKVAVEKLENMVDKILTDNGFTQSDLSWLVPHQANYRIIKSVAKRLNLTEEQVILTVAEHANTSAASIPLALNYGVANNKIKPGELLLLESFGGGLAWGSALIRY
jgi:3-oxoacyl-[acyl-carrier-protein] synthase-3